ncbi:ABC transporter ATP-binding protein [Paenibacillus bouchesdurhonensis]|uniref:ABC transporter ATP-binding protein n=1 Tax=Paenibacillus bouchesdurhonensis TaxID=1870990 RepID=UPI000DA5EFF7|nr:ATP-binding cassette domain-containing protein [Paenibacillus bouchesdurhonensis]
MTHLIEVNNVSKVLSRRRVLDAVSFNVPKFSITGFIGPNGAGKTTLIRILTGLISFQGDVKLNRVPISNKTEALREVGAMVETPVFSLYMTGYQNLYALAMLDSSMSKQERKKRIAEVLELVGLTGREHHKVKGYSLGMKQRLGIAQALLNHPDLLILDEPTNGLDPMGIKEIRDIILKLNRERGVTIFVSSHLLGELEKICDHFIVIQEGKIVKQGSKESILIEGGTEHLEDAFLQLMFGGQ